MLTEVSKPVGGKFLSIVSNKIVAIAPPVPLRAPVAQDRAPTSRWVEYFFAFQIACQLALIVPGLGGVRMVVRVAAFGASLFLLLLCRPQFRKHPASYPAIGILAVMSVSVLHPTTNTLVAGVAQAALYAAILA